MRNNISAEKNWTYKSVWYGCLDAEDVENIGWLGHSINRHSCLTLAKRLFYGYRNPLAARNRHNMPCMRLCVWIFVNVERMGVILLDLFTLQWGPLEPRPKFRPFVPCVLADVDPTLTHGRLMLCASGDWHPWFDAWLYCTWMVQATCIYLHILYCLLAEMHALHVMLLASVHQVAMTFCCCVFIYHEFIVTYFADIFSSRHFCEFVGISISNWHINLKHESLLARSTCRIETHTHTHNCFTALWICLGQRGWDGTRRNIHPLTPIVIINCPLSVSSIYYDPWHPPCSIHAPDSLFHNLAPSFLWSSSWPGTLHFILHTFLHPIIVFLSQHIPIPLQPVLL